MAAQLANEQRESGVLSSSLTFKLMYDSKDCLLIQIPILFTDVHEHFLPIVNYIRRPQGLSQNL